MSFWLGLAFGFGTGVAFVLAVWLFGVIYMVADAYGRQFSLRHFIRHGISSKSFPNAAKLELERKHAARSDSHKA